MPLQNRVDPFSDIHAVAARGTMMGNRGRLHGADRRLTRRRWTTRAWICCLLQFKGRRRRVMSPDRYTELFFLDEATAFAAGHRPCYECRRADYRRFMAAWALGNDVELASLRAPYVDARLHRERLAPDGSKQRFIARLADLPDGTMVTLAEDAAAPSLLWNGAIHPWTPDGYRPALAYDAAIDAQVLTPLSIISALRAGYLPNVHPSLSPRRGAVKRARGSSAKD